MTVGITELPPEGMQLGGVALAGDADRGTKTTEGLSLLFTTAGITVQGPQPQIERLLVWSGLDSASCREKIALPDGRNAAVMELTSGGQSIRFLLPMDTVTPGQAAYLDQALPAWLLRYKGPSAASSSAAASPTAAAPPPPPAASSPPPPAGPAGGPPPPSVAPSRAPGPATREPASGAAAEVAAGAVAAGAAGAAASASNGTGHGVANPPTGPTGTSGPPASASFTPPEGSQPAPDLPPPPPSYMAQSNTGSAPPTGAAPGSPATSSFPPPPPPPRAPGGATAPGTNGWDVSTDPMPEGTAWDTPPMAEATAAGTIDQGKKSRGWRKGRSASAAATAASAGLLPPPPDMAATLAFAPVQPPTQAPVDPVPLTTDRPLPPPPSEEVAAASASQRPMLWKPPIDPATGEPAWDQSSAAPTKPAKKQRGWRKGAKAGAVAAGAAGAVTAAGVASEATVAGAEGLGAPPAPPSVGPPSNGTPPTVAPPPPPTPPPTPTPPTVVAASTPPGVGSPPPAATDHDPDVPAPAGAVGAPTKSNRNLLAVLLVVLVVVIGGIAYFAVKKSSTTSPTTVATTTPTTGAPSPGGSSTAAATALATSLNLRLTDLPNGWTRSPASPAASPTGTLAVAQNVAERNLSTCLGQPFGVVAGLFGDAALPAAAGSADSPTFEEGSDPGVQMASTSSVQTTVTENQVLTGPFASPKFITCYAVYQTALASASANGSVATVRTVTLPVPAGVTCWAFLTTITNPSRGTTQVEGDAYIFGGRDLTRLSPRTDGPPVPQGPFAMAYDAITARVAKALHS